MKISTHPLRIFCLAILALATLAGCRDPRPVSYRTTKETTPGLVTVPTSSSAGAQPSSPALPPAHPDISGAAANAPGGGSAMANTAVVTAAGPGLQWTAPAHWTAKPLSTMRKGSYTVTGADGAAADLSITAFPGDVGGEVANVNRWRGQLQLAPLSASEASAAVQHLESHGLALGVVDFANTETPAQRIHGAMVPYQGATWFFKLTGPDAVVAQESAAFLEFLRTVQPAAPTTAP